MFRGLLFALAVRDVKLRSRQTVLRIGWVVLQPLLASGILGFVFGTVRWSLLGEGTVSGLGTLYAMGFGALTLVAGLLLFRGSERELVDVM
jgi:ABC-type polysaccharide/polyol phosphate export permease